MKNELRIIFALLICNITILSDLEAQTTNQAATYKGGQEAFLEYFEEKITLPDQEYFESRHTIDLYFKIHIGTDGTARITEITNGEADDPVRVQLEALIPNMPKWTLPICNGKPTETILFAKIEYAKDKVIAAKYDTKEIMTAIDTMESDTNNTEVDEDEEKPFVTIEQIPQFPGGETEMMKFIVSNLKYPVVAQETGIEGRVTIRFAVGRIGNITDVRVVEGFDKLCDKEAIRVVKSMPIWIKSSIRIFPEYFILPIIFRLKK